LQHSRRGLSRRRQHANAALNLARVPERHAFFDQRILHLLCFCWRQILEVADVIEA